jgi:hypothetical protein
MHAKSTGSSAEKSLISESEKKRRICERRILLGGIKKPSLYKGLQKEARASESIEDTPRDICHISEYRDFSHVCQ